MLESVGHVVPLNAATPTGVKVSYIDPCIKWWQTALNLNHWTVTHVLTVAEKMHNEAALMEIRTTRVRTHATVFVNEMLLFTHTVQSFQPLLVHELVHLIYDPLAEEHSFQLDYSTDKDRRKENHSRFTRVLEKAVEHTAQAFCKTHPLWTERS